MADKSPFKMPPPADSSVKNYRQKQILVAYMLLDPSTTKQEIYEEIKEIAPESVATLNRATRQARASEKKNILLQNNLEVATRRLHEKDSQLQEYKAKLEKLEEELKKIRTNNTSASDLTDEDFLFVVEPMPQEDAEEKDDED
ncbi:uncharacterized protein V6R79_016137 [Siganus canaliculatus]